MFNSYKILRILRSQESGLYDKWTAAAQESRSHYDSETYKHHEKYQSETLTLMRLRSVFILLLFGLFFSILLFNFENFFKESRVWD